MKRVFSSICLFIVLFVFQVFEVNGQVYPFNYQGSLKDGNVPANGNYEIKFDIFNVPTGGVTQGGANFLQVPVVNGIFSLEYPVGFTGFFAPGSSYWVELSVRPSGSSAPLTLLTPRQRITYTPYSISSILSGDTLKLGGVLASQYILTTDPRLSDARTPTPGSPSYIQNTTTWQANTHFNIGGNGTANIFDAFLEYRLTGTPILRQVASSFMVGAQAGANTTTAAFYNNFFGTSAGRNNTAGQSNSFFGYDAGRYNQTGGGNSFFGSRTGDQNVTGSFNTLLGDLTNVGGSSLMNATAIGAKAFVAQSNSLVLGSINGVNGATADTNVGIGTSTPGFRLHVVGKNFRMENNSFPTFSFNFTGGAVDAKKWQNYATTNQLVFSALNDAETFETDWLRVNRGSGTAISSVTMPNGNVGIGATAPNAKLQVGGGSVYIQQPNSLIITSPNGACWFITVNNAGGLATISVPCP